MREGPSKSETKFGNVDSKKIKDLESKKERRRQKVDYSDSFHCHSLPRKTSPALHTKMLATHNYTHTEKRIQEYNRTLTG